MAFPLERATPASLDLDPKALERLLETVTRHIAEGRYPGAQIALARHGKLALRCHRPTMPPRRVGRNIDHLRAIEW